MKLPLYIEPICLGSASLPRKRVERLPPLAGQGSCWGVQYFSNNLRLPVTFEATGFRLYDASGELIHTEKPETVPVVFDREGETFTIILPKVCGSILEALEAKG